jgi:hypothetical protein
MNGLFCWIINRADEITTIYLLENMVNLFYSQRILFANRYITLLCKDLNMSIFMEKSFSVMTDEERRSLVRCVLEKGDYCANRFLLEECLPDLTTNEERRFLVRCVLEKGDYWANGLLLEKYFSDLTHDECRKLVCRFLVYGHSDVKVFLLKSCFSKSTPEQFNTIVELIRKPFLSLSSDSFCQVVKQADAMLILLFLEHSFSRWRMYKSSPEQFRLLIRRADRKGVLRLLEKYLHKLTDEQFAMMIQRADTMWAEEFLQKHSPQLTLQRFTMVIVLCSPYGMVTLLGGDSLTFEQRQVMEERVGGLFEL